MFMQLEEYGLVKIFFDLKFNTRNNNNLKIFNRVVISLFCTHDDASEGVNCVTLIWIDQHYSSAIP